MMAAVIQTPGRYAALVFVFYAAIISLEASM
jgi:hypothetical protein